LISFHGIGQATGDAAPAGTEEEKRDLTGLCWCTYALRYIRTDPSIHPVNFQLSTFVVDFFPPWSENVVLLRVDWLECYLEPPYADAVKLALDIAALLDKHA
jgi:hypothetical protein